jgi:acetate---CoA ligase (ADP-forming)
MSAMDSIARLLKPRSVAVIGASADSKKTAGRPVAYLKKLGFTGEIFPVNPKVNEIDGLKCYPDIASLPSVPDVAIVLLGAERAHHAVRDLAQRGCAAAIVLASGYTETGEAGAMRQKQLLEAAGSMRILGPNTIGLVNLTDNIMLSATGALEMDHFPAASWAPCFHGRQRVALAYRSSSPPVTKSIWNWLILSIILRMTLPPES